MALIGYERVSKSIQRTENQRERLTAAGVDPDLIFSDHGASGAKASRPGWDACLASLRKGDTLVCVRLDRIGRSVRNLVDVVNLLSERGVNLRVLDQSIDTSTPAGRLVFHVFAAIAEFERELIIERTKDGLATTNARGRSGGRKPLLSPAQRAALKTMYEATDESGKRIYTMRELQATFPIKGKPAAKTTIMRALHMKSDSDRAPGAEKRDARYAELEEARQAAQQAKERAAKAAAEVKPEKVKCYTCGAPAGEPCRIPETGTLRDTHEARKVLAAAWQVDA